MDSRVFRKGDASSCLVYNKTWHDIVDKPSSFDELVYSIVAIMTKAKETGLVSNKTTFGQFKEIVNNVLLRPLKTVLSSEDNNESEHVEDSIRVDAFWDEIPKTDKVWEQFPTAVARAYAMMKTIESEQPILDTDTLQTTKDKFNEIVILPMTGLVGEEE